jgi:hypothetical protein
MVQGILQSYLGAPPLLPGEQRALPWSLRAGGATLCFSNSIFWIYNARSTLVDCLVEKDVDDVDSSAT